MSGNDNTESIKAFDRAKDAIENAKYNFNGGYTQEVYAKTHQGTKAKFAELFIRSGIFPASLSDAITMLFDYRQEADYDLDADI